MIFYLGLCGRKLILTQKGNTKKWELFSTENSHIDLMKKTDDWCLFKRISCLSFDEIVTQVNGLNGIKTECLVFSTIMKIEKEKMFTWKYTHPHTHKHAHASKNNKDLWSKQTSEIYRLWFRIIFFKKPPVFCLL